MSELFQPGALVRARGREWVVLPNSSDDVLMVKPIGGLDDEIVGICTAMSQLFRRHSLIQIPISGRFQFMSTT